MCRRMADFAITHTEETVWQTARRYHAYHNMHRNIAEQNSTNSVNICMCKKYYMLLPPFQDRPYKPMLQNTGLQEHA